MSVEDFCAAAWNGDVSAVKQILSTNSSVINSPNARGQPAIYCAARQGHVHVLGELLMYPQLDVNITVQQHGGTSLHAAGFGGHPECVALLLMYGADPNQKNRQGTMAVNEAKGIQSIEVYTLWENSKPPVAIAKFWTLFPVLKNYSPGSDSSLAQIMDPILFYLQQLAPPLSSSSPPSSPSHPHSSLLLSSSAPPPPVSLSAMIASSSSGRLFGNGVNRELMMYMVRLWQYYAALGEAAMNPKVDAMLMACQSYVNKENTAEELLNAIRIVYRKEKRLKSTSTPAIHVKREAVPKKTKSSQKRKRLSRGSLTLSSVPPAAAAAVAAAKPSYFLGKTLSESMLYCCKRQEDHPIIYLIDLLMSTGLDTEGLFRIPGEKKDINMILDLMDTGAPYAESANALRDPHVITGVLKELVNKLPDDGLISKRVYTKLSEICGTRNPGTEVAEQSKSIISALPPANKLILSKFIKLFTELCNDDHANLMTADNIGLAFPTLLVPTCIKDDQMAFLSSSRHVCNILKVLIAEGSFIFQWDSPPDMSAILAEAETTTTTTTSSTTTTTNTSSSLASSSTMNTTTTTRSTESSSPASSTRGTSAARESASISLEDSSSDSTDPHHPHGVSGSNNAKRTASRSPQRSPGTMSSWRRSSHAGSPSLLPSQPPPPDWQSEIAALWAFVREKEEDIHKLKSTVASQQMEIERLNGIISNLSKEKAEGE